MECCGSHVEAMRIPRSIRARRRRERCLEGANSSTWSTETALSKYLNEAHRRLHEEKLAKYSASGASTLQPELLVGGHYVTSLLQSEAFRKNSKGIISSKSPHEGCTYPCLSVNLLPDQYNGTSCDRSPNWHAKLTHPRQRCTFPVPSRHPHQSKLFWATTAELIDSGDDSMMAVPP